MAKIEFNFSLDGWMFTEVEGKTLEECRKKLYSMTFEELLENGLMKNFDISNVDEKILEQTATIHVISVNYNVGSEEDEEKVKALPQTFDFDISYDTNDKLDYEVEDKIYELTHQLVNSCEYDIIKTY